jgi:uncharacterized ferredoxin-like protein
MWTILMSFIEVPEMPVLRGEEAVDVLNQKIEEFQQQKGKRLTEKQAEALTKAANQMIMIIRAEPKTGKLHISNHLGLFKRFGSSRRSK